MTGLDSIAMAVAHLESKDEVGDNRPEESKSDGGPTPPDGAFFVDAQPRLVSGDDGSRPDTEPSRVKEESAARIDSGTAKDGTNLDTKPAGQDYTIKEETCHDTTSVGAAPTSKTETNVGGPVHNFRNLVAMQLPAPYRPVMLDLTAPPEAAAAQAMMMGLNGGGVNHTIGLVGSVGLTSPHHQLAGEENPRRLPNQISQKILLKHQSDDGAADDPIASLLSRVSHITSDLPLLFRLMDELYEIGVRECGPPAEVVPPTTPIDRVGRCDVLSGRGGETNHHYGNVQYRRIVKACQPAYLLAKRRDKPRVATAIVRVIRSRSGRFLKKDPKDNMWRDVGNNKAREKSSQALREGAPELRSLVQLPDQASQSSDRSPSRAEMAMAPVKLTPSAIVMAMSGNPQMIQYGAFAGAGGPLSTGAPWAANAASGSPADVQTLAGQPPDVYQQAIQQYQQLCGNKRPAPSETPSDGVKKQRADGKDDNASPVDVPV